MNENNFYDRDFPFENRYRNYGKMPELTSVEDVRLQESVSYNLKWYNIPAEVFDEFLSERFGYSIEGFRKIYLSKHMADFSEDEISGIAKYANPIPQTVRACFQEANSVVELIFKYKHSKGTMEAHSCTGPLSLHYDTISNFTIIRARFSKLTADRENLEKIKKESFFGYYFSDEKFRFFISSSMQLDLTVIYEEIDAQGSL